MVDENAIFNGGDINTFRNFVASQIVYPKTAKEKNITGKVIIQFMVAANGEVKNIKVLKSAGNTELDKAASEAISESPNWTPAKIKGSNVPQLFVMPVNFELK